MNFFIVLLASCEKKESEENKPEEPAQTSNPESRSDLVRKVIRYNASGAVEDSVLFQYDPQNRISKIEYGTFTNGYAAKQTNYAYSVDPAGNQTTTESHSLLNNTGQYQPEAEVVYRQVLNLPTISKYPVTFIKAAFGNHASYYEVSCDSMGLVSAINQTNIKKQMDYYLDYFYTSSNGNIKSVRPDSYPGAGQVCTFEYYGQPYEHDLFVTGFGGKQTLFWPEGLENVFDNRHRFLGKRNRNLPKKMREATFSINAPFVDTFFEYEFNSLGMVSKIKSGTASATNGALPMTTRYELFYY